MKFIQSAEATNEIGGGVCTATPIPTKQLIKLFLLFPPEEAMKKKKDWMIKREEKKKKTLNY